VTIRRKWTEDGRAELGWKLRRRKEGKWMRIGKGIGMPLFLFVWSTESRGGALAVGLVSFSERS
jgi:hypothetical protein